MTDQFLKLKVIKNFLAISKMSNKPLTLLDLFPLGNRGTFRCAAASNLMRNIRGQTGMEIPLKLIPSKPFTTPYFTNNCTRVMSSFKVISDRRNPHLQAFLLGTVSQSSPLSKLRGQSHVLRYIWIIVCDEWWDLHIDRSFLKLGKKLWKGGICDLTKIGSDDEYEDGNDGDDDIKQDSAPEEEGEDNDLLPVIDDDEEDLDHMTYPKWRKKSGGCPVAIIEHNITFPQPTMVPVGTFDKQESAHLYVNMMPIIPKCKESIPECCLGYWPLIQNCTRLAYNDRFGGNSHKVAYLTIDERPVVQGHSQRRPGLHVESPGVMPIIPTEKESSKICKVDNHGNEISPWNPQVESEMRAYHSLIAGGGVCPRCRAPLGRWNDDARRAS